jgi:glycosyltransferase involved in cell wall biosynthesis
LRVSVAVPVRNEERTLGPLLDSLLAQTLPPDEIILADGGSTDGTVAVARTYADRGVRVLEIGPAYPGRGRNEAIVAARNDWIALTDAGCVADPGWLAGLTALGQTLGGPGIVFGTYEPQLKSEWDVAQALAFVSPVNPATQTRSPSVASILVHRTVWYRTGRFPEHLRAAEDLLFIRRIEASGTPVAHAPTAVVRWNLARGPQAVFRRFRLYSGHHLAAGLYRSWHLRVLAMDIGAGVLTGAGYFWRWLLVVLGAGALARVLRTILPRRANIAGARPFRPDRVVRVAWLLFLADLAMWLGALDYIVGHEPPR